MSESKTLIGMVCYGKGKDAERYTLPIPYVEAIRRSGGRPFIIPPGETDVLPYIEIMDGFILAGGGDIDPKYFAQDPHPKLSDMDPERDATELEMTKALIERSVPLLAICRGIQVLNVARGGDLIQHLEDEVGQEVTHQPDGREAAVHRVQVEPGSQLSQICGGQSFEVASKHHQAAGHLGQGLRAVGWTRDGIIEAVELDDHPEVLAVQWHPEETAARDSKQQALFDWLVGRARTPSASMTRGG